MKTPVLGIEIIKIQHVNLARPQKYFLPVAIAGLQFTVVVVNRKKIPIYHIDITIKNISKIKRAFSGNRKLATVNSISMLSNIPVLHSISRDSINSES